MEDNKNCINNFTDDILRHIISFLPTKCAIRTSVLSRRWRYLWTSITDLDFEYDRHGRELMHLMMGLHNDNEILGSSEEERKFANSVNQFMELHDAASIRKLRLCLCCCCLHAFEAEHWILFAARKQAQELHLDFSSKSFWAIQNPKLPDFGSIFKGSFGFLRSLLLRNIPVSDDLLQCLLSNCPLIESLSLGECANLRHLSITVPDIPLKSLVVKQCSDLEEVEIYASNLLSFKYYGVAEIKFTFAYVPNLVDAMFIFMGLNYGYHGHGIDKLLCDIAHIKTLTICGNFIEYLRSGNYEPEDQLTRFQNLKELQLWVAVRNRRDILAILFVLKSFLYLEKLFLCVDKSTPILPGVLGDEGYVEHGHFHCLVNHLKILNVERFSCQKEHMELLKLLIENSMVLESITIIYSDEIFPLGSVKKQLRLWQQGSCPQAKLLVSENPEDMSVRPTDDVLGIVYPRGYFC